MEHELNRRIRAAEDIRAQGPSQGPATLTPTMPASSGLVFSDTYLGMEIDSPDEEDLSASGIGGLSEPLWDSDEDGFLYFE